MALDNPAYNPATEEEKRAAQRKYCSENKLPFFADSLYCASCGGGIYKRYTKEYASKFHITRCPWCSKSFID